MGSSKTTREQMIQDYRNGAEITQLQEKYPYGRTQTYRILRQAGVTRRKKTPSQRERDRIHKTIQKLNAKNIPCREIDCRIGRAQGYSRNFLVTHNIEPSNPMLPTKDIRVRNEKIRRLYKDPTIPVHEIMEETGVSRGSIQRICRGVYRRHPRTPQGLAQREKNILIDEKIQKLYQQNTPYKEIARKLKIRVSRVHDGLCRTNFHRRIPHDPDKNTRAAKKVVRLYKKGKTTEEIQQQTGRTTGQIYMALHQEGVPLHNRKHH